MDIFILLDKYKSQNIVLNLEQERDLLAQYIYSTNRLEGNNLTLVQTQSIIDNDTISGDKIKVKDILEQKGTYKALIKMLKAVINKESLSIELIKELNWLIVGNLFQDDYYFSYKERGQKYGDFKVKNNRIMITSSKSKSEFIEPYSSPENVIKNIQLLINQFENSDKNVIEKASFLAQGIWLNQPFIDGNKRTARLLINFMTMSKGFPLFTYESKGALFNEMLVSQYTECQSGLIKNLITECLQVRIKELLDLNN
ncbi:Fic family protein [Epilithonimonas zeae]|uniref:Fic/DOC family protein n=1 Tax=Epilithonimonas zeae TaxID=1416779 RepID=A0A1N6GNW3_9FLAO|nr:Fic family protein [Epilithonimonas zeae]SIO09198.1 Fic/DOC family protein [Epilithonimonas zeae]